MGSAKWPQGYWLPPVTASSCMRGISNEPARHSPPFPTPRPPYSATSRILRICARSRTRVNALGPFDAIIHNAGIGYRERRRIATIDGLPQVFAVNTLAPYVLTALIEKPRRLVYLSSGMHQSGDASLADLEWNLQPWNGAQAYSDSKLHDVILAFAIARRWPDVLSNALEPGWVPTKMGGRGAPDDLEAAPKTQVWLATSEDPEATVTGEYFYHQRPRRPLPAARDPDVQNRLLAACAELSRISVPI
jgi:NAD(P)-dependent dehydrogenase (short-subunit alcohol dehydrogenase family)